MSQKDILDASAPDNHDVFENFKSLSQDDLRIFQVMTVCWRHISQTDLKKLLGDLRWTDSRGGPLFAMVNRQWREKMEELRLLSLKQNRMQSIDWLCFEPMRMLALANQFQDVRKTVDRVIPPPKSSWYSYEMDYTPEGLELRNALFARDYKAVLKHIGIGPNSWSLLPYQRIRDLVPMCLYPMNVSWVNQLPDMIKFQTLGATLMQGMISLSDLELLWDLARQWFPNMASSGPGPSQVLAAQHLVRGEPQKAGVLLADDHTAAGLALAGWRLFLLGEYDQAGDIFDNALLAEKKETRKRNVRISGLPGIFQNLCLLHRGRAEDLHLLRKQAEFMVKDRTEQLQFVFDLFAKLALVLLGEMKPAQFKQVVDRELPLRGPYTALFYPLALLWLGERPGSERLEALIDLYQYADDSGYRWYAREARLVLEKAGAAKLLPPPKASTAEETWQSVTNLLEPKQDWELALDALKNLRPTTGPQKGPAIGDIRIIWRLECSEDTCSFEPREQKLKSNGQWTPGRPVALQRLRNNPDSVPGLTDHDRRLCMAISEETYSTYYRGYTKTVYNLSGDQALLAAVGHPLIFSADYVDQSVEVGQGEPVLQVLNEKKQLRLHIEPKPRAGQSVVFQREGDHCIRIFRFDDQLKKLGAILGPKGLAVPATAREQVLETIAEVAPLLTVHSNIGGAGQAEHVPADSRPVIRLRPLGDGLAAELFFRPVPDSTLLVRPGEGGKTLFAEVEGRQVCATRDEQAEQAAVNVLLELCPTLNPDANWSWRLDDPESALETLLTLQEMGDGVVLEWPEGKRVSIASETGANRIKVSVRGQRDWFSMEGGLELDDGVFLDMSRLLDMLANSPGRFVRLGQGDFLCLTRDLRKRLDALSSYSEAGRFHPLTAPVMEEVLDGMRVSGAKPWKDMLRRVRKSRDLTPEVPVGLRGELREYQVEGFQWLVRLAHWGAGACLADDMGLGKTIQALALILTRAKQGPTLVLAPTSVCFNWMEETARFAPSLRHQRFGPGDRKQMLDQSGPFDLIVCSYGLLQTEVEKLAKVRWSTIVADEAQAIKNVFTKRSRAAMTLPAGFRMITTGTPIENHLGELWNLFTFINPGLLGSMERFNRKFAGPIEQGRDSEAKRRLKNLIRPFILRRLKSEVLTELPSRTEVVLPVELNPEEAAVYDAIRRRALEKMAEPEDQPGHKRVKMLAEIMRLRRACCHPELVMPGSGISSSKLQAFGEILDDLLANRHQALVFSQFVGHLQLVRAYLEERGVRYQYLDGATPIKQRQSAVNAFQAGEGDLFLISLKAGGFGLNLTAADYVIHMDPWWNPAVEDQASDRAHRIGQQRPVTIYRLVTRNTIEEKILDLHRHKRDLATSLLEGTDTGAKLSLEEMMDLISGND